MEYRRNKGLTAVPSEFPISVAVFMKKRPFSVTLKMILTSPGGPSAERSMRAERVRNRSVAERECDIARVVWRTEPNVDWADGVGSAESGEAEER